MPRLLFDFPGRHGRTVRTALADPVRVVTATRVDEVIHALRDVQAAVEGGLTAGGFLSYEAAPAFEPRMRVRGGGRMPLLWFGLFEREEIPNGSEPAGVPEVAPPDREGVPMDWTIELDRAAHARAVARIHAEIAAGRTYQVNLTTRFRAPFTGDAADLYDRMRRSQGPGYHALLDVGSFTIVSASPELFFRTRGGEITTRPMKGTRPRGRWAEEDRALRDELAGSVKDTAENLMIVDLLRNDLGRLADSGSVHVPRLLDVERFRTVWQMTSTVTATLREGAGLTETLSALFPCGSVTGAPKISTMGVIAALETSPREVYCGAIGLVRPGGDATFSVPIRTAWIDRERGRAEYGTGGGVVWGSSAEGEYAELLAKAVLVRAPWPPFRLLETMRLEDGELLRRARHLRRLRGSADHFGFPFPDEEISAALDAVRHAHPRGLRRVRLLLDEDGLVTAEVSDLEEDRGEPHPVAVATSPVHSGSRFLYHKTTRRDACERAHREAPPDAWDVLLVNERGELTEFTRGNLVVELGGELLTPPVSAGLLPGCLRAELLEEGVLREAALRPEDLGSVSGAWLVNSLRGRVAVTFPLLPQACDLRTLDPPSTATRKREPPP